MGRHDGHLPKQHINKAVSPVNPLNGKTVSSRVLEHLARGQGQTTKQDAKDAKQGT